MKQFDERWRAFGLGIALAFVSLAAGAQQSAKGPVNPTEHAAPSADEVKEANNPLASLLGVNLQNYYAGSLSEVGDSSADTFLLRVVAPIDRFLIRATLPFATLSSTGSSASGLGDLNVFVTYTL